MRRTNQQRLAADRSVLERSLVGDRLARDPVLEHVRGVLGLVGRNLKMSVDAAARSERTMCLRSVSEGLGIIETDPERATLMNAKLPLPADVTSPASLPRWPVQVLGLASMSSWW